jgi:hypothetical protein
VRLAREEGKFTGVEAHAGIVSRQGDGAQTRQGCGLPKC